MQSNRIFRRIAILSASVAIIIVPARAADISDSFNTDASGWTHAGDSTTPPAFHASGGNPGGFITIDDLANGVGDFFVAPARYLGNQTASIGKTVSLDINLSNAADGPSTDLYFTNGTTSLSYVYPTLPTTTGVWIHETATLSPSDPNWHLNNSITGPAPTAADFQAVFSSLTTFEILGDFRSGTETVGLDNVVLQSPEPASLGMFGLASLLMLRRRN